MKPGQKSKNGWLLVLLFLLSLVPSPLFSQSLALMNGSSELLVDISPSKNLTTTLDELPPIVPPQINPSQNLEKRQATMLQAWIDWYKMVKISWTNLKNSYKNQMVDLDKDLSAKDKVIAAQADEISYLKEQLKMQPLWSILSGVGGAGLGFTLGKIIK